MDKELIPWALKKGGQAWELESLDICPPTWRTTMNDFIPLIIVGFATLIAVQLLYRDYILKHYRKN